ncbi:antitoxin of the YeeV-YeeU toxin-antitoxin system; CP4-44 prophage [Escherichia coli]|uniref:Antitoxin of the YeeV-YeeU toxin-antitoxin system CP4-44 prophage n=32 Tax=Enterobacteriaceae TaxID=543 RepID=A0A376J293_ECOLX|nr:antitoxin of the YeeV-YeeU toxin-antitoxin system; CP4-44 prophage [Escherichia coli]
MSDTLPGTTLPDDNHDRPWWGLPCTVTPCFGARLVQEGNRLHYLADRAGIRGLFSDADAYHLDQAFPLLMKQLELMLTSGELNPRHQHTVTLYAKGLTCKADTLSSCDYVLSGCLSDARNEKLTLQNSLLLRPGVFTTPLFHFYICISGKSSV